MSRRGTLRRHAFQIALVVVLTPLLGVMAISGVESLFGDRIRERTEESAALVAEALRTEGVEAARALAARRAGRYYQRIRVLDSEGTVYLDENRILGHGPRVLFGDVFYGPERAFVLERLDRDWGPPLGRAEVVEALVSGQDGSCRASIPGNLFLCASARKVNGLEGAVRVVLVEGSSRRALQAVHESQRQLVKLLLFTVALGLALAWWTVRSFVRPVEALRSELLARATQAVPKALALPDAPRRTMGRPHELGELTNAFNTVLTALAERTRTNEAFLTDLAHEFKNPVAAVRACAERLAEPGPLDPARQARAGRGPLKGERRPTGLGSSRSSWSWRAPRRACRTRGASRWTWASTWMGSSARCGTTLGTRASGSSSRGRRGRSSCRACPSGWSWRSGACWRTRRPSRVGMAGCASP
ncbi:hypothetical protein ACLESD_32345 [Pyxidicoccus sp. 3LFB2]